MFKHIDNISRNGSFGTLAGLLSLADSLENWAPGQSIVTCDCDQKDGDPITVPLVTMVKNHEKDTLKLGTVERTKTSVLKALQDIECEPLIGLVDGHRRTMALCLRHAFGLNLPDYRIERIDAGERIKVNIQGNTNHDHALKLDRLNKLHSVQALANEGLAKSEADLVRHGFKRGTAQLLWQLARLANAGHKPADIVGLDKETARTIANMPTFGAQADAIEAKSPADNGAKMLTKAKVTDLAPMCGPLAAALLTAILAGDVLAAETAARATAE